MINGGYMGKILYVNLTSRRVWEAPLDEKIIYQHLGGTGLAAHLLSRTSFQKIEPLGPENVLIFSTGPLTGTPVPTSGRFAVAAKSPQTGIWGESDCGGYFGIRLKNAGYDALVIQGASPHPVKLLISDTEVKIEPAHDLWGLDTYDTHQQMLELAPKGGIVCIGPAGEQQIIMANIMAEGHHGRAAGRCGLGAVMGSKKLKAIACTGSKQVPVADKTALREATKVVSGTIIKKTARIKEFGTAGGVTGNATLADMSAKNWREGNWADPSLSINGEVMKNDFVTAQYRCPGCIVGCGKTVRVKTGIHAGGEAGLPEYETIAGFGAQCDLTDPATIIEANDLCNRLGIDTISVSGTIAFLMEAIEQGVLQQPPDGPALTWGNGDAIIWSINKLIAGESIGLLLRLGVKRLSEILGQGTEAYAVHCKGLEFPYHDPRALFSLAPGYATSARGACHRGCTHNLERFALPELGYPQPLDRFTEEGKGKMAADAQDYAEIYNCLKLCQFLMGSLQVSDITRWITAVTGWNISIEELLTIGERNLQLKRLLNVQCGVTAEDDALPHRILQQPFASGGAEGKLPNLDRMLADYYRRRGWDERGIPLAETLEKFQIKAGD